MSYVLSVTVSNGLEDLFGNKGSLYLRESFSFTDFIKEFTAIAQFSHHIDLALVLIDFVEA